MIKLKYSDAKTQEAEMEKYWKGWVSHLNKYSGQVTDPFKMLYEWKLSIKYKRTFKLSVILICYLMGEDRI